MLSNEQKALIGILLISVVIGVIAYPRLPELMISHWNAQGQADGYSSKMIVVFLMPLILAFLVVLCIIIPKIDPLKANIQGFKVQYERLFIAISAFLLIVQIQSILWNLGTMISFNITIPVLLGFMFIYLGFFLEKAKRNWFVGIRTPWTLSSDVVWDKTHKTGSVVFKIAGVISFLGILPQMGYLPVIVFVLLGALYLFVYSYIVFRDEEGNKDSFRKAKGDR